MLIVRRRDFMITGTVAALAVARSSSSSAEDLLPSPFPAALATEGLVEYIERTFGAWNERAYKYLLGAANEFKEGDAIVGVAAANEQDRKLARQLLNLTRLEQIDAHPLLADSLYQAIQGSLNQAAHGRSANWTFGALKQFLLEQDETAIHALSPGLSSDVIACVTKLMSNSDLIAIGAKVFNPLPGSNIGARGYLGARIQPNSPTDNVEDIRWQVLNAWAYGVGDVLLGTNPVSSETASVAAVEATLQELLNTFELQHVLPHCVLSHIDVQAQVEHQHPGQTALWFQSIAGSDAANATFDLTLDKMLRYASTKQGPYGLYFETGQGADFTNGHGAGFDMVIHESRKYGFARLLSQKFAQANKIQGQPWVHLNDVAGFIGPEVFRTRGQLVRCCLEDIVMGKLHGLCLGLDVCSTLHMDVSLEDLDWCLDQLAPACPAYLMALPTKIDPMLGYLTTSYQDHVRLREKFGCRVNDRMVDFFKQIQVLDQAGNPTEHFGDPLWVYVQYRRRQGDGREQAEIIEEGKRQMSAVRQRGVFLASGFGSRPSELNKQLSQEIQAIYEDAKASIWARLTDSFKKSKVDALFLKTRSIDREDYILHPVSGEQLSNESIDSLRLLRQRYQGQIDVQIVISDGLNALAIDDTSQLDPFVKRLTERLQQAGLRPAPQLIVVDSGRVRAGYQIGQLLFGELNGLRGIIHLIGERPGSGHRTFSAYMTCPTADIWASGKVDHDRTRVVAGIASTSFRPLLAAEEASNIFNRMWQG
jgi:ethanolamine ammonia-lyase large subunit